MRKLNSYMNVPTFQYEDIQTVTSMIQKDDLLITLDIPNGFHHIPIAETGSRQAGDFFFGGHYYRWKVAPFGFAVSLLLFCKTVRPVVQYLRAQGLRLVAYVDDLILMLSPTCMDEQKTLLVQTLENLGWIINQEKSSLNPEDIQRLYRVQNHHRETTHVKNPKCSYQKTKKESGRNTAENACNRTLISPHRGPMYLYDEGDYPRIVHQHPELS